MTEETDIPILSHAGPVDTDLVVAFLIPMRPRTDERVWTLACELLEQTLSSFLAQSNTHWIAVIAGHDRPVFMDRLVDPRVQFYIVDFDPLPGGSAIRDGSWKKAFAAMKAAPFNPRFHMAFDADDLAHRDFVATLARTPDVPAVVFDRGWEFDLGLRKALARNHLADLCGSTVAYSCEHFPMPQGRDWNEWNKVPSITIGHDCAKADLVRRGLTPWIPDDRLVAYVCGHDSNISQRHYSRPWRRRLGFSILGRPLQRQLRETFQLSL